MGEHSPSVQGNARQVLRAAFREWHYHARHALCGAGMAPWPGRRYQFAKLYDRRYEAWFGVLPQADSKLNPLGDPARGASGPKRCKRQHVAPPLSVGSRIG